LNWLKEHAPVEFKRISDHQEALADKTTWAIVNEAGDFWSNDDGWVDQGSKTLFYAHEKLTVPANRRHVGHGSIGVPIGQNKHARQTITEQ
jgi:hypothetical protein